ncbi:MAG: DMT family transporter [Gemmatimonadetes bacterium]|nr:MAG: DMT family transporter [Gemmatimonadota bacterium]
MTSQTKAYFFVALAVLFWSTVATAFKIALRSLDFIQMLFYASASSLLVLLVVLVVQGNIPHLFTQSRRDWFGSALLGLLNPFLYYLILFKAYDLLPAQQAQPLNYTWPVVLSVLSVPLLGQKLTFQALMALLISFSGVIVISRGSDPTGALQFSDPVGVFLAVFSSVVWALFWIFNVKDERDPVLKLCSGFIFGTVYVTITMLVFSEFTVPPLKGLLGGIYIGLFEMGLTFVLWLQALNHARDSASISHFVYLSPFLSLVFIYFVLGEAIAITSIIGLVLIISGILIQTLKWGQNR